MNTTLDAIFDGALTLEQPRDGHRFGIDSVILACQALHQPPGAILDVGCGCGVLALIAGHKHPHAHLFGLDIQTEFVAIARRNAERNALTDRTQFDVGDIRTSTPPQWPEQGFALILMNPPYFPKGAGRLNPDDGKAIARHELHGDLAALLSASAVHLHKRGVLRMIYPAEATPRALDAARRAGLKVGALRPVHAFADQPARFILLELRRAGRQEMSLTPGLIMYTARPGRQYTPAITAMLQEGTDV